MRNGIKASMGVAFGLVALTACSAGPGGGYTQPVGSLLGAAAGGLAGAQLGGGVGTVATAAAGTLLGAAIGGEVGASLDRADAAYARTPGYQVRTPPSVQAPIYVSPAQAGSSFGGGWGYDAAPRAVPSIPAGCQIVGAGIWCEQANGTFSRGR